MGTTISQRSIDQLDLSQLRQLDMSTLKQLFHRLQPSLRRELAQQFLPLNQIISKPKKVKRHHTVSEERNKALFKFIFEDHSGIFKICIKESDHKALMVKYPNINLKFDKGQEFKKYFICLEHQQKRIIQNKQNLEKHLKFHPTLLKVFEQKWQASRIQSALELSTPSTISTNRPQTNTFNTDYHQFIEQNDNYNIHNNVNYNNNNNNYNKKKSKIRVKREYSTQNYRFSSPRPLKRLRSDNPFPLQQNQIIHFPSMSIIVDRWCSMGYV